MTKHSQFKHLIFDLDGVLVDSSPCHAMAFAKLWRMLKISGPAYKEISGRRTIEIVAEITEKLSPSASQLAQWVKFKQNEARKEMTERLVVFPDSVKILQAVKKQEIILSLATGASRISALAALKKMDINGVFYKIVTAEDVTTGKPNPMVFLKAVKGSGISLEQTLVIEDSYSGIDAAIKAGIFVCSVRSGARSTSSKFLGDYPDIHTAFKQLVC